jgi:hypothetical protein
MSNTANLVLPFLAVGQAQKHVTVNESLRRLDAIIQLGVISATTAAQPAGPVDGAVYILPSGKTGADWSAFADGSLGYYRDGSWVEIAPREGWLAFVRDSDQLLAWTGSAWSLFPAAKLLAVSATDKLLGRSSSGAGAAEEIACSAAGRALLDDPDATTQRTTLGLGTAATQNTGTSGANVPLLNGANAWSGQQVVNLAGAGATTGWILRNSSAGDAVLQFNPSAADSRFAELAAHNNGSNTINLVIRPSAGGSLVDIANFHIDGVNVGGVLQVDAVQPRLDDTFDLGTASLRFDDVYATNGVIQTSDAREKSPLRPLGEAEKRAIRSVVAGLGVFQWLSALSEKGEDARLHCGVTAQAVKHAFEAEGLDPHRYALFCADALEEEVEVEETITIIRAAPGPEREVVEIVHGRPVLKREREPLKRLAPVVDETGEAVVRNGKALTYEVDVTEEVEVTRPVRVRRPKLDERGEPVMRLGVRYDQLFAMALAAMAGPIWKP